MMHYDIVIVGGGLVGASLALALANSALTIAVIDARGFNPDDERLFALNVHSCVFLKKIIAWDELTKHATPIEHIHVSVKKQFGVVKLHAADINISSLGQVIPAKELEKTIYSQLKNIANVTLLHPALLQSFTQHIDRVDLNINYNDAPLSLSTKFMLAADGTHSTVRKQLNIATRINDYQQTAIVTRTQLKRAHEQTAYERFTENAVIAMLPLQQNTCATIISTDNVNAAKLMALSDAEFTTYLQKAFGYRLGKFEKNSKRFTYPLQQVIADNNYSQRVLLIGNAAHTIHPIAAQGLNVALFEVTSLAKDIQTYLKTHQHINDYSLQAISKKLKKPQALNLNLSHNLTKLFASNSKLLNVTTQIGMISMDMIGIIKQTFIKKMIGME